MSTQPSIPSSLHARAEAAPSPRDWLAAMPTVILARAVAEAFGGDRDRGGLPRGGAAAQTA